MTPYTLSHSYYESIKTNLDVRFVMNLGDFYTITMLHRERLVAMAQFLISEEKISFGKVHNNYFISFLNLHDEAKLNLEQSRYYGRPLLNYLYKYYGMNAQELNEKQGRGLQKILKILNQREANIAREFFKQSNINSDMSNQFLRLEMILDLVDRGMNTLSAEEFNRQMKKASEILQGEDQKMALLLEEHYSMILQTKVIPSHFPGQSAISNLNF